MRRSCAARRSSTSARTQTGASPSSASPTRSTSAPRSSAALRVSFRSGHRNDVTAIAELGHEHGALVLADSYQAIGALELDVRTLGADVVTGGTVKYLLGSAGLGFMWLRELAAHAAPADADRLVRRRGHLRDVHRRLLAARDRAALRQRHAARAVALSGRRRHGADRRGRSARDRGARAQPRRPTPRRSRRARRDRRHGARRRASTAR